MKYFKIIYNSFLWAMVIALICFGNEWLQMRVNTGYILGASFVLLTIIFILMFRKKPCGMNAMFTIINLIVCTAYGMITYGFKRLQIVPAAIIREGLHQPRAPFSAINTVLLSTAAVGIVVIAATDIIKRKKK